MKRNPKGNEEEEKMNKRLKKVTALVMATGMAVTGNFAAYAAWPRQSEPQWKKQ